MTRHLDSTLKRDDWEVLILHYLGLDHIGHISGPYSSLIQPKLMEMDDILKKIHGALVSKVSFPPTISGLLVYLHLISQSIHPSIIYRFVPQQGHSGGWSRSRLSCWKHCFFTVTISYLEVQKHSDSTDLCQAMIKKKIIQKN